MKKATAVILALIMILSMGSVCFAQQIPEAYMEISVTGDWHIFSKNMQDEDLLDAVGMSGDEINKVLENTGSESIVINGETGEQIYVMVSKNDKSKELWNISQTDDAQLMADLKSIVNDGFSMDGLDYNDANVKITTHPYMKLITVSGSTYYDDKAHGVVVSGTFVNGSSVVFMMLTQGTTPTAEEIAAVEEVASGISFTVIKEKTEEETEVAEGKSGSVFQYILGGFGAIVLIILCVFMIEKMKHKDESAQEDKKE